MKPSTEAVLALMRRFNGACPRDFANHDIYRYGARIFELRRAGWTIGTLKCRRHRHRRRIVRYVIVQGPKRVLEEV
jgi:hypothetical protein